MEHHPVFAKYAARRVEIPAGCVQDSFLGTLRRDYVLQVADYTDQDQDFGDYPPFDEEYYEWVDILESVAVAARIYTFVELGAGFGRWSVRAAFAAAERGDLDVTLVTVEPDRTHFEWMADHYELNGLDPKRHIMFDTAINDADGYVYFSDGGDRAGRSASEWYGQSILPTATALKSRVRKLAGHLKPSVSPNWDVNRLAAVSLPTVFAAFDTVVDLVDMDVQGAEVEVLAGHMDLADARIRRFHIGTHSAEIETDLRALFSGRGWERAADWPGRQENSTPYGTAPFLDGIQTWLNPRLS